MRKKKRLAKCKCCGKWFPFDVRVQTVLLCSDCYEDITTTCDNCQSTYLSAAIDIESVRGLGDVICPACVYSDAYYCSHCNEQVSGDEWDSNRDICLDCSSDSPEDEE